MNNIHEKALETITLHLPETLKRDLQDLALVEDRHHLAMMVYGRLQMKAAKGTGETRK